MLDIDVRLRGPLLTGAPERDVDAFLADAQQTVANQALADVHQILDASIRNPTPYYETQLIVQRLEPDVVVHDRGIVYGPWLEGTSSRNRTTRFKGYAAFRRARDSVDRQVPQLVAHQLRQLLQRLED
ncbi:hypothetical protein [Actinomadura sp. 21ATH]|uniref:hypothetical protein n=1 Tax=Actinomadura sp. 21ATH TaxID=1735444 RepID=UPI0035C1D699